MASYVPEGEIKTGSFVQDNVSEAEIARREKLGNGEHSGK